MQHACRPCPAPLNHLPLQGVWEKDEVRKDDSFVALEEVFELAAKHGADFVLLGGDLFHDNKPSRQTVVSESSEAREERGRGIQARQTALTGSPGSLPARGVERVSAPALPPHPVDDAGPAWMPPTTPAAAAARSLPSPAPRPFHLHRCGPWRS